MKNLSTGVWNRQYELNELRMWRGGGKKEIGVALGQRSDRKGTGVSHGYVGRQNWVQCSIEVGKRICAYIT